MKVYPVSIFLAGCLFFACQYPDQKHAAAKAGQRLPAIDSTALPVASPYFRYQWHGDTTNTASFDEVVEACHQQAEAVMLFCGTAWNGKAPDLHLFPSMETKGLTLNNTAPVQVSSNHQRVDAVANPIYDTFWLGPQNQLILRQMLGQPRTVMLETGLALTFNPKWQRYGFRYWARHLSDAGLMPGLQRLASYYGNEHHSPLIRQVAAAAFCDFLIHSWGRTVFLERYANWQPDKEELRAMQDE